jgi:nicotinamide riboside kinase
MSGVYQLEQTNQSPQTAIYVVGPSSTGKTTLCHALAEKLGLKAPAYITEVARTVMREIGCTRKDIGKLAMQTAIMKAQLQREDEGRSQQVLLSDRSAIDPIVYAILTSTTEDEAKQRRESLTNLPQFQLALSRYRRSTFLLLTPVPEWVLDDGIRSLDNQVRICIIHNSEHLTRLARTIV